MRIRSFAALASVAVALGAPGVVAARTAGTTPATTAGTSARAGTAAPAQACPTDGLTTLKVSGLGTYTDGILLLATDRCYFADAGIKVEISTVANPPASIAALTGGEFDIAYAPSIPLVRAVANGAPLRVLAAADGYSQAAIDKFGDALDDTGVYVKGDSTMTSAKDLEGKSVAVPARGAQLEVTTSDAVAQAGGDPSKVNFVALDLPNMVDAVKAGQIDAAALVSPFSDQAKAAGLKLLDANGVGFFGPGAVGLWLTTQATVDAKGDLLKAFRTAVYKANDEATKDSTMFRTYIAKATGIDQAVLDATAIEYVFPSSLDVADLNKVADKLVSLKFLDKAPDLSAVIVP